MPDEFEQSTETAKKLLDIQKDITQELEARKRLLDQIKGLDTNIEAAIYQQMAATSEQAIQLKTVYNSYEKALELYINTSNNVAESVKKSNYVNLQSHKDEIDLIQDQISLSKMRYEVELKKLELIKKQHDFIGKSIQERFFIQLKEIDNYKVINAQLTEMFPKMKMSNVAILSGLMVLTTAARELYNSFEKQAAIFRKFSGMFRETAKPMREMAEDITIQFFHVGVTLEGTYATIKSLGVEMGGLHNVTKDLVLTASLLSAQLGVSEENTAGMLRNLAVASKSTMQAQKSMAYFAASISEAAGVPLNVVMSDVAKMSGTAFAMMSKMPLAIVKAAVEARRLNTTINDMARASESILDFQNNVNAEMEASVLLGQSINLQRARYLAYNKDIVGSTKEILDIAKKIDFQNLDVFQMQSFARATGRSVDELTKMLQAERQMDEIRASTDPKVQAQFRAYEAMKNANEAIAKNSANNLETIIKQKANQERMVALQNKWNQLWMKASEVLLPVLDIIMSIAGAAISIGPMFMPVVTILKAVGNQLMKIEGFANMIFKVMSPIRFVIMSIKAATTGWMAVLGKLLGFAGFFGKWIPVLGWIITAFQLISSIWKNFDLKAPFFGLDKVIKEVLLQPFIDAWNWIKGIFVGRSPSELAMGIVRGLISVQTMMRDALLWPFKAAWAWVSGAPTPSLFSTTPQTPAMTLGEGEARQVSTKAESSESPANQTLDAILIAIKTLNNNLESGKIGVYIDGQLMSATLARQTQFKNGFGMNVV